MILLTGGTGFVGRHLARQFSSDRSAVRVLSRQPGRVPLPEGISWVQGDLGDASSLHSALRGVETVVHAAAVVPGGATPDEALERVNADGTRALADAARAEGVRRFVHISSAGVYGDGRAAVPHRESDPTSPGTAYERSKLAGERTLANALDGAEVSWTILRPQGLYGSDRPATTAFFREVGRRRFWLHGPARVLVHPTHVQDLASAVRLVINREDLSHEVINIGGDRAVEFRELIALIGARVGHVPAQYTAPRWTGEVAARIARLWSTAGQPPASLARMARGWVNRAVSIDKARRLLGFEPSTLEHGLEQTVQELLRTGVRLRHA